MKIKLYRSATVSVNIDGFRILQDPWLVDGEYYGSWSHYPPFDIKRNIDEINSHNIIYISHIHPDHCSDSTMKLINKKDHKKWLEEELNNKGTIILVVYKNSERIGMVRYNSKDIFTYVSIGIEKKFRSLGYGAAALKASEMYLKKSTIVIAKVKKINKNSINMFLKNKFKIFLNKKNFILIKILRK